MATVYNVDTSPFLDDFEPLVYDDYLGNTIKLASPITINKSALFPSLANTKKAESSTTDNVESFFNRGSSTAAPDSTTVSDTTTASDSTVDSNLSFTDLLD